MEQNAVNCCLLMHEFMRKKATEIVVITNFTYSFIPHNSMM